MSKKHIRIIRIAVYTVLLVFILGVVTSYRYVYQQHDIEYETNIKIGQITDTHFVNKDYVKLYDKVIDNINEQEVDVFLFTGDLFQVEEISTELQSDVTKVLSDIECEHKLAVLGNHDLRSTEKRDTIIEVLEDSGFTVLRNENVEITVDGVIYNFIGLDDLMNGVVNYTIMETTDDYEHNFVLAHEPDMFSKVQEYDVIAMYAGHSHGGQVRVPLIGHLLMVPGAREYPDHHYYENGTHLYTSFGTGESALPIRMFNPRYVDFYYLHN